MMSVAAAAGATTPIAATTTKRCIDLKIKFDFKISLEIQLTIIAAAQRCGLGATGRPFRSADADRPRH
jgi:hypothetical protein